MFSSMSSFPNIVASSTHLFTDMIVDMFLDNCDTRISYVLQTSALENVMPPSKLPFLLLDPHQPNPALLNLFILHLFVIPFG